MGDGNRTQSGSDNPAEFLADFRKKAEEWCRSGDGVRRFASASETLVLLITIDKLEAEVEQLRTYILKNHPDHEDAIKWARGST